MQKNVMLVFAAILAVIFIGFGINIMDIDASQYAEMSREMAITNSYLQVYELGKDYLDKPPFLFWISSLSIKFFGVNNFAFKFPSFLFSILALYATYKFCLLYYKKEIAVLAMLVLASCQAFFLMNHDIKTDTILMGFVALTTWHLAAWFLNNKWQHFIFACIGIAGGMATKGPVALIVPILAFGSHFIVARNFKVFFKWQYLLAIVFIAALLLPMCMGLYYQFDVQPTKLVNGKTGVSGLRFFFWTQSFGRITGESVWNNNKGMFFLVQNLLWAFLPWILVFLIALFFDVKNLFAQRFKLAQGTEFITTGGFILTYLALGSSKYQLPHYIFVALPFAAVITAKFLYSLLFQKNYAWLLIIFEKSHFIIFTLLWVAMFILIGYCFVAPLWMIVLAVFLFTTHLYFFTKKKLHFYFLKLCLFTFIAINFFLNVWVYPSLLQYQAGSVIGNYIKNNNINTRQTSIYKDHIWHSLHFYANDIIGHKDSTIALQKGDYVIAHTNKLAEISNNGKAFDIIKQFETYGVSRLKIKFLNPTTRLQTTTAISIIKIK